ncbi:hypothetical protein P7C70_g3427, partial [Phenoliferia sp. Uapishka_3]
MTIPVPSPVKRAFLSTSRSKVLLSTLLSKTSSSLKSTTKTSSHLNSTLSAHSVTATKPTSKVSSTKETSISVTSTVHQSTKAAVMPHLTTTTSTRTKTSASATNILSASSSSHTASYAHTTSGTHPTTTSSSATAARTSPPVLVKSYQGSSFFEDWFFADYPDPTNGVVDFVNQSYGLSSKLAYVNAAGVAVIAVDNTTWFPAYSQNRQSVRISSYETYNIGTLAILDMAHISYGPGVWPAAWMVGPNWPYDGEIDIVEGVNSLNYLLKTFISLQSSPSGSGAGCAVISTSPHSFGPGFANVGDGVFAMRWTSAGIFMWQWPRSKIPKDISSSKPDSSTWGVPFAAWPASTCNPYKFFADMNFVFDITLCGDWAGDQGVWASSGVAGQYSTCEAAVGTANLFDKAYFEVNYLKMYSVPV